MRRAGRRALHVGLQRAGEGETLSFCVEGTAGEVAVADTANCPFAGTPGGIGVDEWFATIESILVDPPLEGRTADVVYDDVTGHPLRIEISGGEIDSLLVETLELRFEDDLVESDDPNFSGCEAGSRGLDL